MRKIDLRRKKFRILKHIFVKYKDKDLKNSLRHPMSLPNYMGCLSLYHYSNVRGGENCEAISDGAGVSL
jgi:hypothetical protein